MSLKTTLIRLMTGMVILAIVLILSFALSLPAIERWGATDEEVATTQPGDELLPDPIIIWTNSITIDAHPAEVWPWIAQIGDTRGGFYSYTFIENRVGSITGATGYNVVYRNASRIVPEWQNPAPSDEIIQDTLKIRAVKPGEWLLAEAIPTDFGWTWLWRLYPVNGGEQTRLVVRCRIQVPPGQENPLLTSMMNIGGFVMEQNMMQGIKVRAEGGSEPAYIETVEIVIWLAALVVGLAAAVLFLVQRQWQRPLIVAVVAVLVLVVLTIVQPPIWLRLLLDALLLAGLWWAYRPVQRVATAVSPALAH